jgi:outer membrane protein, heavy metal efflux system
MSMFKKKMIGILILAQVLIFNYSYAYAGTVYLETLTEEARNKNPEIIAARKRWEAAKARIPQAKSLPDPTLGVTVEKIPKGTLKLDRTMPEDRMLSIAQMFPFIGKLSLKGKIALVESQMFAAEYKNKELEIITEVKNAYYDLFMSYKEIDLNEQNLKLLEEIAKIAEAKYLAREIKQEDVMKINLEIARLSNTIENLKQEKLVKQARLNTLLNRDPENGLGVPAVKEEETILKKDIKDLYALAVQNQPELSIFDYAIERNKQAKALAKRNLFPDIMVEVFLREFASGGIGPWDLVLSFTVPFWFWTKQRYEIKEAIASLEEAEAVYAAMKNKVLLSVKDVYTHMEIAKNKINLYKTNLIHLLESSLYSSLGSFRAGKGDVMVLLDTQRMLIDTHMDYYKALVEYNTSLSDLEKATGVNLGEVVNR